MLDILRQYFFGIIHYWWLLMFGLLGAANTAYKWFHPDRKDLPIPHWIRVYFAIGALLIAQFLLYRDSIKNLGAVILEKQSCNSDNWHLKERVNALSIAHSPAIPQVQSEGSAASAPHRSSSSGKNQSAPSTSDASSSPQPVVPSQTLQQTPLESLTQVNRNLSRGDRERLANALYEFSQELEKMAAVGYKLNQWSGQFNTDMQNNSLEKTFADRRKELNDMSESAKALAKSFVELRDKWKYYERQRDYVFGDNPDNEGPNALINAMSVYIFQLDQWAALKDRDNPAALNLVKSAGVEYSRYLNTFFKWKGGCDGRLAQMKQSIQ
jgi:hypothetical protein